MRPLDPRLLRRVPEARPAVAALGGLGTLRGLVAIGQAFAISALVVAMVDGSSLTGPGLAVGVLFALRGILAGTGELLAAWAGTRVSSALRERLVGTWLRRPAEDRPESSRALTLATRGTTSVEPYVARYLPALVSAAVLPVLAIGAITALDWVSALIVAFTVPLLPVFAALIGHATAAQTSRRWRAMASLSGHFLDVVRGLPTLVSYGRASAQSASIAEVSERHRRATVQTLRIAFLSSTALELLATISVAMVAVATGLRLASGTMSLGVALTVILLAPEVYWPIRRVGAEFHAAADGAEALDELFTHLDHDATNARAVTSAAGDSRRRRRESPATSGEVEGVARGLTYRHPGSEVDTLHGLDLDADGHGLTVITGPSGVGKSTVLELLAGLRTPTRGTVTAPRAHLVTQRPFLVAGPIRDSLLLGAPPGTTDEDAWSALREVGMDALVAGLPGGLDAVLGDDGFGVSAGQRARLALARARLSDAPLLLLDEPTAHLDDGSAQLVNTVIRDLAHARTVLAVTHRPELLRCADQHLALAPCRGSARESARPAARSAAGAAETSAAESRAAAPVSEDCALPHATGQRIAGDEPSPARQPRRGPVRAHRRGLVVAAVLGGLASASGIALTATSGWLIVQASTRPVILTLLTAIVGVRAFGIARPALRHAERVRSHDVALGDLARRRVAIYDALVPLTPARLGRRGRSALLTGVVGDLDDQVDAQVRSVVPVAGAALAGGLAAGVSAVILPAAGAVIIGLLGGATLTAAGAWLLEGRHRATWLEARAQTTAVGTLVSAQALELQAVGGSRQATSWLQEADRRLVGSATRQARGRALATATIPTLTALATVTMAVVVTGALGRGLHPAMGTLLVLTPLATGDALGILPDAMTAWARARAARARVHDLLDQRPAVDCRAVTRHLGTVGTQAPRLELAGVTASWTRGSGTDHAATDLGPLDLTIEPGEHLVVTGPNGCGKSTLLAVLARHLDPATGALRLDGADVTDLDREAVRSRIAVMDDETHVFATTLRENLRPADPGAQDGRLVAALDLAGLGRWVEQLPDGLDTRLGQDGRGVSGGERARLGLARAVLSRRPVLLLDEPVAHLDHATAVAVFADLQRATRDRTVVVVSHRPDGLAGFDRVLELGAADTTPTTARPPGSLAAAGRPV